MTTSIGMIAAEVMQIVELAVKLFIALPLTLAIALPELALRALLKKPLGQLTLLQTGRSIKASLIATFYNTPANIFRALSGGMLWRKSHFEKKCLHAADEDNINLGVKTLLTGQELEAGDNPQFIDEVEKRAKDVGDILIEMRTDVESVRIEDEKLYINDNVFKPTSFASAQTLFDLANNEYLDDQVVAGLNIGFKTDKWVSYNSEEKRIEVRDNQDDHSPSAMIPSQYDGQDLKGFWESSKAPLNQEAYGDINKRLDDGFQLTFNSDDNTIKCTKTVNSIEFKASISPKYQGQDLKKILTKAQAGYDVQKTLHEELDKKAYNKIFSLINNPNVGLKMTLRWRVIYYKDSNNNINVIKPAYEGQDLHAIHRRALDATVAINRDS